MTALEAFVTLILAFAALCFVLFIAYVTIRWMGTKMSGHQSSRVIKVIDRVVIGQDKCLLVVRVGDQNLFIGMSGDAIVKLSELPELGDIDLRQPSDSNTPDFAEVLRKALRDGAGKLRKKDGEPSDR